MPYPFEFAFEGPLARCFLPALLLEPLLLLLEPSRVIALERDAPAAIELENPAGHLVEKIAVMGDGNDGARIILEKALQPGDQFRIEVVGRLVEQQEIGPLQQETAQRHPPPLAAGESGYLGVARRTAQRVHRDLDDAVEFPPVGLVDLFLQLALLGDQRIHLGWREIFGETRADRLEPVEQRLGLG